MRMEVAQNQVEKEFEEYHSFGTGSKNRVGLRILDTRARSITKAITWRISGSIVLSIIGWLLVEDVAKVSFMTLIFNMVQLILYYFHERIWNGIEWGKRLKNGKSSVSN